MNSYKSVNVQELWEVLYEALEVEEDFDGYDMLRATVMLSRDAEQTSRVRIYYCEQRDEPYSPTFLDTKRARYTLTPDVTNKMYRGFANILGISTDLYRLDINFSMSRVNNLNVEGSTAQMALL